MIRCVAEGTVSQQFEFAAVLHFFNSITGNESSALNFKPSLVYSEINLYLKARRTRSAVFLAFSFASRLFR